MNYFSQGVVILTLISCFFLSPSNAQNNETTVVSLTLDRLIEYIMDEQPLITKEDAEKIATSAVKWSQKNNVPTLVALSVIEVETLFLPYKVSKSGAHCLMQIMPGVWKTEFERLNIQGFPENTRTLHSIDVCIQWGTKILSVLHDRHKTWSDAVCNYNPNDCQNYLSKVKNASIRLTWSSIQ